jgi:hypothetical protein
MSVTRVQLVGNVSTGASFVGVVTATSFSGSGANLTGIAVTANVRTSSLVVSGVSTLGTVVVGGATTQLIVVGDARITGILTIGSASITLNGASNIINVGTGLTLSSSGVNVTGVITATAVSAAGSITEFYAGQYWNLVSQADVGIGASQVPLNQYLGQLAFVDDFSPTTLIAPRIQSFGQKTSIISGNTVSLTYNTGGGNIAICTNPSGDITLAVAGIPTDSTFDNTSLTFSVFVNQTGTARSCTAVTLNGLSASIKWPGGSLSAAISGVTTTSGTDIFSFTGINTIGSAGTTANYRVLGEVNGGFR